jgi:hypothetical protein
MVVFSERVSGREAPEAGGVTVDEAFGTEDMLGETVTTWACRPTLVGVLAR